MSYQVLARKYRPQKFDEVVGQEHVTTTLKNALTQDRIHHAYLFTGVRGTGKTSLARIFAMCLNCEDGPQADPDPDSSNCQAIQKGQFLDVIEIDGASNTSVESVRELREQVKYTPAAGKYKVYIIDEVHMLSTSAFNALLKTLEEPPPHVIFLFATTEVHKIPITILSRCQRFDLKRLTGEQISTQLANICQQEGVKTDPASLDLLAKAAEGSMRDGQSLLDMAIGICGKKLAAEQIQDMLGLVEASRIENLTRDCFAGRLQEALERVQEIYNRGLDLRQVASQWVEYLHDLALYKAVGPKALGRPLTQEQQKQMEATTAEIALDDLQVAFQTVYRTAEQIFRADSPKILFDLLLVKLVHGAPFQNISNLLAGGVPAAPALVKPDKKKPRPEAPVETSPPHLAVPLQTEDPPQEDQTLARALKNRPQIKAVLDHARGIRWSEDNLEIMFEPGVLWMEMMQERKEALAEILSVDLGRKIRVVVQAEAKPAPAVTPEEKPKVPEDPIVQQAVEILNATVKEVKKG